MSRTKKQAAGKGSAIPPESPLVPNRALQRMYAGMVESRLLEKLLRKRNRNTEQPKVHGQEACRVSVLLDLAAEDFTSDVYGSITTAYLRGEPLTMLLRHRPGMAGGLPGLLPELPDSRERLQQALGVAVALKQHNLKSVVIYFASPNEVKQSVWLPSLHRAAQWELPMLFVILPAAEDKKKKATTAGLSARSTAAGVPGIPVEASDAIALYRVAQECLGRARVGGGPALMECVPFIPHEGKSKQKKATLPDPIKALEQALLLRQICTKDWPARVAADFQARLAALLT